MLFRGSKIVTCNNHTNGFEHLDQPGIDGYDLGVRYKEEDSDSFMVQPETGVKAWAEPHLAMYVSVRNSKTDELHTLRYGLTRSHFADGALTARQVDKDALQAAAEKQILEDVAALAMGRAPRSTKDIHILFPLQPVWVLPASTL